MQILKDIGSYAGLGAVVGLAVLSALYFSQARDVRRLREWAGRAPERAAEGTAQPAQRVTAVPQAAQPAAATGVKKLPQPAAAAAAAAAKPAAAAASAAVPATAQAKPAAATPAAQGKTAADGDDKKPDEVTKPDEAKPAVAAEGKPEEEKQPVGATAEAKPSAAEQAKDRQPAGVAAGAATPSGEAKTPQPTAGAGTAAPVKPGDGTSGSAAAPDAPAKPAAATPASPVKPADSSPATPRTGASTPAGTRPGQADPPIVPRKAPSGRPIPSFPSRQTGEGARPAPSQTAILPPYGEEEPRRPSLMRRTLASPRYLVLAIAGVLIVGGAAAFGLNQLSKNEAPPPKNQPAANNDTPKKKTSKKKAAPITPANVTVSVLNGTTVPGLAAQIGDRITAQGFQLGNVTNSSDQQRAESVVLYAPGAEREAAFVGRKLGIAQRERMDPQSQALAGDARVVVITGADKTQ